MNIIHILFMGTIYFFKTLIFNLFKILIFDNLKLRIFYIIIININKNFFNHFFKLFKNKKFYLLIIYLLN